MEHPSPTRPGLPTWAWAVALVFYLLVAVAYLAASAMPPPRPSFVKFIEVAISAVSAIGTVGAAWAAVYFGTASQRAEAAMRKAEAQIASEMLLPVGAEAHRELIRWLATWDKDDRSTADWRDLVVAIRRVIPGGLMRCEKEDLISIQRVDIRCAVEFSLARRRLQDLDHTVSILEADPTSLAGSDNARLEILLQHIRQALRHVSLATAGLHRLTQH